MTINPMISEEQAEAKASRARKRRNKRLMTGAATGIVVGLLLTAGMLAMMSEGPTVATTMPGAGAVAQR